MLVIPGVPHRASQDDIHAGYFIPKGSLVIPNIWSVILRKALKSSDRYGSLNRKLTHDPRTYANPHSFNPDRFITSEAKVAEPDPHGLCFGFGRRFVLVSRTIAA